MSGTCSILLAAASVVVPPRAVVAGADSMQLSTAAAPRVGPAIGGSIAMQKVFPWRSSPIAS